MSPLGPAPAAQPTSGAGPSGKWVQGETEGVLPARFLDATKREAAGSPPLAEIELGCFLDLGNGPGFIFGLSLGGEFLRYLESNRVGVHLINRCSIAESIRSVAPPRCKHDTDLDEQARERSLIGTAEESGKQLVQHVGFPIFADTVLPRQRLQLPLIQERKQLHQNE